jgi:hypothetical protein
MNGLLVRVGIDSTLQSGGWNAPVNPETDEFAYVPILECAERHIKPKYRRSYEEFIEPCKRLGICLPSKFTGEIPHLDPDFLKLTYGDIDGTDISSGKKNHRGKPLLDLGEDDILVFYASLDPAGGKRSSNRKLIYAIIGLFVLAAKPKRAEKESVREDIRDNYAHTRGEYNETDILVSAKCRVSGRLERCIQIGEWRDNAYRVKEKLLKKWGGLSAKCGYIQRSARLPHLCNAEKFYEWFKKQIEKENITLMQRNN